MTEMSGCETRYPVRRKGRGEGKREEEGEERNGRSEGRGRETEEGKKDST